MAHALLRTGQRVAAGTIWDREALLVLQSGASGTGFRAPSKGQEELAWFFRESPGVYAYAACIGYFCLEWAAATAAVGGAGRYGVPVTCGGWCYML